MENLYPNTSQVHNFYIDQCLHLLEGNEVKVLMYAIRKIIGYNKRQDHISLTQFENGLVLNGIRVDNGTGLNRVTVVRCLGELKKYGLILELYQDNTYSKLGNVYSLQFDLSKVDIGGLEKRAEEKLSNNIKRFEKIQKSKKSDRDSTSLSNKLVYPINQSTSLSNKPVSVDPLVYPINTLREEEDIRIKNKILYSTNKEGEHSASVAQPQILDSNQKQNIVTQNQLETETKLSSGKLEKTKTKKNPPDPRANHPAIVAVREIIKRFPEKLIWDEIIDALGDAPNLEKLNACAKHWAKKSSNMGNLSVWLFDWYKNGLPLEGYQNQQFRIQQPEETKRDVPKVAASVLELERRQQMAKEGYDFSCPVDLKAIGQKILSRKTQ